MSTVGQATTRRRGTRSVVVLLEGDVSELPLLSAATTIRELTEAPLEMAWVDGPHAAARTLLTELARDHSVRRLEEAELHERLHEGVVRGVMMSQAAWARHAGHLWGELERAHVYVRRQGVDLPRRLLCCADSEATAAGLLARIASGPWMDSQDVSVVHALAQPPMWAQVACQLHGVPLPPPQEPRFELAGGRCPRVVIEGAGPEAAVRSACLALEPDLVVLGWHRHQLPLPSRWLHPTAWRLSTRLPHDVLLVPLPGV